MYLLEKKVVFLVNLTSAVYISSSDCTLTFGTKSEGSLAYSPFVGCRKGRSPINDDVDLHARIEPRSSRSRELSGHDLNDRNIGVLSGNHIRPLIRKTIGVTLFQRSAYVCMKKGCYADRRAIVGSYLETIYT